MRGRSDDDNIGLFKCQRRLFNMYFEKKASYNGWINIKESILIILQKQRSAHFNDW